MNASAMPADAEVLPRREILGILVASLRRRDAMDFLIRLIDEGRFTRVAFLNAHSANVAARNERFALLLRNFLVLPDGIGVDLASKLLHGAPFPDNLNGTDFIPALLVSVEEPLLVAMVGSTLENAERAAETLQQLAPQHRFIVVRDGYFSAEEESGILAELARLHPDVLLVAMGVPRQELWIADKLDAQHCTLAIGVGALLDFLSGAVPRAPDWVRKVRMEWAFRLLLEPKRLFRRYVLGNPVFLARVTRERLSRRIASP